MFKTASIAALALALAGSAFTASANGQLARSIGVEPGAYSTAELIRLQNALEDNDRAEINFIINKVRPGVTRGSSEQLAGSLGLEPGAYTTVELIEIADAIEENDQTRLKFLQSHTARVARAAESNFTGGSSQLARLYGFVQGEKSTAELAKIHHGASRGLEDN